MDEVLSFFLWLIVDFALIGTAKAVVAVATLGRWRGERYGQNEARVYGPAGALSFHYQGQRVITNTGLLFVGTVFYVLAALAFAWLASEP